MRSFLLEYEKREKASENTEIDIHINLWGVNAQKSENAPTMIFDFGLMIEDIKNISEIKLQETVRKDALKHKIVEQREESKKKKKKRMFKAILIAVIVNIVMRVAFNIISEMNFENNMIPIISFVIYVIALMIFALYPTIVIISFIIYNVKSTLDPYFRTKEGEELNRSIEGLKNYLKDYTLLDEQEKDGIVVWEEYLVYSVLFNQNKKMIEKYKSIVK